MSQLVPRGPASLDILEDYEPNMYSDWNRDEKRMLLPLDGLGSLGLGQGGIGLPTGVQTTTTPTLTPTTLRLLLDEDQPTYHNEAGFVPPVVQTNPLAASSSTYINMVDSKAWQGGSVTTMGPSSGAAPATSSASVVASTASQPALPCEPVPSESPPIDSPPANVPSKRNVGGRRPNKSKGISPEEEERRQVRRERNKAAAARCRKRRMDHTNALVKETEGLENKKQGLQHEIQELKSQLEELSYLLESHTCRMPERPSRPERSTSPPDVKPLIFTLKQEPKTELEPPAKRPMLAMSAMPAPLAQPKPSRPTSLPVSSHTILRSSASEIAGISITTPSTGIPLNFDSLMDGGTGLTPVSGPLVPSCSSQQRNQNSVDLSSPDSNISNKLVSL